MDKLKVNKQTNHFRKLVQISKQ